MDITDDGVPADALIGVVTNAIARAGQSAGPGRGLRVVSARVTLRVVASRSGGAGLSFSVPFLGARLGLDGKVSDQAAHTIDMTLVPQEAALRPRAMSADEVGDVLVSAIATIRDTTAAAAAGGDPWGLSAAAVDICFGVTTSGTISLGIEGGLEKDVTNTLRLTFEPG